VGIVATSGGHRPAIGKSSELQLAASFAATSAAHITPSALSLRLLIQTPEFVFLSATDAQNGKRNVFELLLCPRQIFIGLSPVPISWSTSTIYFYTNLHVICKNFCKPDYSQGQN